jgi:hypothetical protein
MLLNGGMHDGRRILSRAAVELMTTHRLPPEQPTPDSANAINDFWTTLYQAIDD